MYVVRFLSPDLASVFSVVLDALDFDSAVLEAIELIPIGSEILSLKEVI